MMFLRNAAAAAACVALLAIFGMAPQGASATEAGEWVAPEVGRVVVYTRNGQETSSRTVSVDGYRVTFVRNNVECVTHGFLTTLCRDEQREFRVTDDEIASMWPLEVGKTISFQRVDQNDRGRWWSRMTLTVDRTEEIETPLGIRRAFVVKQDQRGVSGNNFSGQGETWIVPELGMVKWSFQVTGGRNRGQSFGAEMVRVE